MLVLWDRGFQSCTTIAAARAGGPTPSGGSLPPTNRRRWPPSSGSSATPGAARPGHGAENQLVSAPAADLVLTDHARWEFAPAADEIKTHQRPIAPLRSRKPGGVIQEIYALLLTHYVVRAVIAEAARTVDLATTHLSFRAILRLIRAVLPEFQRDAPAEHPRLHQQRLADIAATHLPERPNRSNPRVVKQKMSDFRVKGPHHQHWPQPTKPFRDAVTLQN